MVLKKRSFIAIRHFRMPKPIAPQHIKMVVNMKVYSTMLKIGNRSNQRFNHEKQRWFRKGQRFRAGSEGAIPMLKRGHGMNCYLNKREDSFGSWVALRVIAQNLKMVAPAI